MSGNPKSTIVFLNHWARHLGGAEHSLLDILAYSCKKTVSILITSENGVLVDRARSMGLETYVVPCDVELLELKREKLLSDALRLWRHLLSYFRFVGAVRTLIKKTEPDLIYANVPKSHILLCILARLGYRGACCFHIREIFSKNSVPWFLYRILFPAKRSKIIAVSEAVKSALPAPLKSKTKVIYNGVEIPKYVARPAGASLIRLLYLGRVVPWKGCHELIEIFYELLRQNPPIRTELTIMGDTLYWPQSYRLQLAEKIKTLGIASSCFLMPHTTDIAAVFRSHDIFCTAAINEPFGRSVAEAQSYGLAVVAYDSGGIKEIVDQGKSGYLVPLGDKKAFVDQLLKLISEPSVLLSLGEAGHKKAASYFNKQIQIPKIFDHFIQMQIQHKKF